MRKEIVVIRMSVDSENLEKTKMLADSHLSATFFYDYLRSVSKEEIERYIQEKLPQRKRSKLRRIILQPKTSVLSIKTTVISDAQEDTKDDLVVKETKDTKDDLVVKEISGNKPAIEDNSKEKLRLNRDFLSRFENLL